MKPSDKPRSAPSGLQSGVQLPEGVSASRLFHDLLREAASTFPALREVRVPREPARFRRDFGDVLVKFEAARVASAERTEIASFLVQRAQGSFRFLAEDGTAMALGDHMAKVASPLPLRRVAFDGVPGLVPSVPYRGKTYEGRDLALLAAELVTRSVATHAAAHALQTLGAASGPLTLTGRRFAVLGAGAELSPVALLLAAGAEVLWIDRAPPPAALLGSRELAGALSFPEEGVDLLAAPHRVAATLAAFAGDRVLDLVLAAYAPGGGREWRLAAAMNAIARVLDPKIIQSLTVYVSPTTPCVLEDTPAPATAAPIWQRALAAARALKPATHVHGDVRVARALVPLQGQSYQAAQYVEKTLAAEHFASRGIAVSANVLPITATRSLEHPLFQAGFIGAARFGVEIFPPETTRALGALLALSELVEPRVQGGADERRPSARHVHGGVHTMAYALDEAIRVAAVVGLAERPALLQDLLLKRRGGGRAQA